MTRSTAQKEGVNMSNDRRTAEGTSLQREQISKQPDGISAILQVFHRILRWLAGFIQLTEDEQREAGIYPGYQQDK